jgi:hypothetical protein
MLLGTSDAAPAYAVLAQPDLSTPGAGSGRHRGHESGASVQPVTTTSQSRERHVARSPTRSGGAF